MDHKKCILFPTFNMFLDIAVQLKVLFQRYLKKRGRGGNFPLKYLDSHQPAFKTPLTHSTTLLLYQDMISMTVYIGKFK